MTAETATKYKMTLKGIVVSDKMDKTAVVLVERFIKHPKYGKYMTRSQKYKAHDPLNQCRIGEEVTIRETRPLSKDKHFEIVYK